MKSSPNPEEQQIEEDEKLEGDLEQLNRYLSGLKKDRQQTEKENRILSDRTRILNQEENKAAKKFEIETKNQENFDRIRVRVLQDKEMMEAKKKKDEANLEEQKIKNYNLKSDIDNTMKNWRPTLTLKNKTKGDLIVKERSRIRNAIRANKEKKDNINKEIINSVQQGHALFEENKKIQERQKKLELKKKIEEQIQKELELKNSLEEKISERKAKNEAILKRIKDYHDNTAGVGTKHYSMSVKKFSKRSSKNEEK